MKLLVTTYPFGIHDKRPRELFKDIKGLTFYCNNTGSKYSNDELIHNLKSINPEIIIAGTESYTKDVIDVCKNLKIICRVGIGLDGIDIEYLKSRNIILTNTPDAPTNAVAELTILQMLNMLRKVQNVSEDMLRREKWNRYVGKELKDCNVGIIGVGRIGKSVIKKLEGFTPKKIYINDTDYNNLYETILIQPAEKEFIIRNCDIISIHIPLHRRNRDYIKMQDLEMMKRDVRLLNMSRGGIVNEKDLYAWLKNNPKSCAAVDTYENESYNGELCKLGNAYLTPHLGSCTLSSRYAMEMEAAENALNYYSNFIEKLKNRII